MRAHVVAVRARARRPRRHRGHGRRRLRHVQHLDDRRARRRRLRLRRRQARQPRRLLALGLGRHARGARRADRAHARAGGRDDRPLRLRLPARARAPSGDAPRRAGAALARRAHGLQPARAAHQPGRRAPPADRRLRGRSGSSRWPRRSAPARLRARHGRARRAGHRRALALRRDDRRHRARRRGRRSASWTRASSASDLCAVSDLAGGDPQRNAEITLAVLGGEPGPAADATALNAAAALVVAGRAADLGEGLERRARRCAPERPWRR